MESYNGFPAFTGFPTRLTITVFRFAVVVDFTRFGAHFQVSRCRKDSRTAANLERAGDLGRHDSTGHLLRSQAEGVVRKVGRKKPGVRRSRVPGVNLSVGSNQTVG